MDTCWLSKRPDRVHYEHHHCLFEDSDVASSRADGYVSVTSHLGKSKPVADDGPSFAERTYSPVAKPAACFQPLEIDATRRQRQHSQDIPTLLLANAQPATSDTASLQHVDQQKEESINGHKPTAFCGHSGCILHSPKSGQAWLTLKPTPGQREAHHDLQTGRSVGSACAVAASAGLQLPQHQSILLSSEEPLLSSNDHKDSQYQPVRSAAVLPSSGACTPECLSPVSHAGCRDSQHAAALQDALKASSIAFQRELVSDMQAWDSSPKQAT